MNPQKAEKILRDYVGTGPEAEPVEFNKAVALGAEALGYIQRSRTFGQYPVNRQLPGETEE